MTRLFRRHLSGAGRDGDRARSGCAGRRHRRGRSFQVFRFDNSRRQCLVHRRDLIQCFNRYIDERIAGIGAKTFSVRRFDFSDWRNTDTITEAQRRNKELTFV
jgi:hypothetical protein